MAAPNPLPLTQPRPPTRGVANRTLVIGVAFVLLGMAAVVAGSALAGLPIVLTGAIFLYSGALVRLSGDAVGSLNTAYGAALEGRAADAEGILDGMEARFQLGYIRRVIDVQRAGLALRRGDLDAALTRAGAAITRRVGLFSGNQDRAQIAGARGLRALILASRGEVEGARAEVAAMRATQETPADALARAAVAEAVILERAGEREALATHLVTERRLLFDHTAPRERAIARAYRRMLKATKTSVYRSAAPREAEPAPGAEPSVADWIAQMAPAAAPFARARAAPGTAEAPPVQAKPVAPDLLRAAQERLQGKNVKTPAALVRRTLGLWIVLILMFLAIWQFLSPGPPAPIPEEAATTPPGEMVTWIAAVLPAVAGALPFLVLVLLIARNQRRVRGLSATLSAVARGDAGAEAQLQAFTRARQPLTVGQAHLHLARLAEQRADFDAALSHCDSGVAAITAGAGLRALAAATLLPDLLTERALVLAATDRAQEAGAEMAVVATTFPAYPFRAPAELRVALMARVRRGDLEGAARLVEGKSEDLQLPLRDETLADLVRAAVHPESAGAGELERLGEDLRDDAELRRWLEATAPSALAAFSRAGQETSGRGQAGHDAEAEALAEQEAAGLATARASV